MYAKLIDVTTFRQITLLDTEPGIGGDPCGAKTIFPVAGNGEDIKRILN